MGTGLQEHRSEVKRLLGMREDLKIANLNLYENLEQARENFLARSQEIEKEEAEKEAWIARLKERNSFLEETLLEAQSRRQAFLDRRTKLTKDYDMAVQAREKRRGLRALFQSFDSVSKTVAGITEKPAEGPDGNTKPCNEKELLSKTAVIVHALTPFKNESSGSIDYEVIFQTPEGARRFLDYARSQNGAFINGAWCKVSRAPSMHIKPRPGDVFIGPADDGNSPEKTRVLVIHGVPEIVTVPSVKAFLQKKTSGLKPKFVGSEHVIRDGSDITIFCDSIDTAASHLDCLKTYAESQDYSFQMRFGDDECSRPMNELAERNEII
ncbi:hypothetical protein RUND412_004859 [Rhizina undulata]